MSESPNAGYVRIAESGSGLTDNTLIQHLSRRSLHVSGELEFTGHR